MTQDTMLNTLRKEKVSCTIFLTNGFQLRGLITHFDAFVVMIKGQDNKQQMIFKHAISTIVPQKPLDFSIQE